MLLLLAASGSTSCRTVPHWLPGAGWRAAQRSHCPIELVPSEQLAAGSWRARVEVRALADGHEPASRVRGEIAANVEDGVLRIAAVTAFGTRAFTLVQRGRTLEVDDTLGHRLGLEPLWILDAFHRQQRSGADEPTARRATERIDERFDAGLLSTRRFAEAAAGSRFRAEVAFSEQRVDVRNEWCGYEVAWLVLDP